jgi:hypothetical protein
MGIWLPGRCRPLAQTELRAERAEQWLVLIRREIEDNLMDVFNPREAMTDPTITELEQRITMLRQNINELIEQAAAYSGAEDENRTADRIAQQEQELSRLIELRDALLAR